LFFLFLLVAAPFIALVVRIGFAGEYRGASGLVVAMWVFVGVAERKNVLLVVIAAKLVAEALELLPSHDAYVTVSIAHYAGAAAGLVGGIVGKQKARSWPGNGRGALECADWVAANFSDQRRA